MIAVGLSGNKHVYDVGSSATVICYSNFTIVSMQWFTVNSNVSYTTEEIQYNELLLHIDTLHRQDLGTIFKCKVINLLPTNVTKISTIELQINTLQKSEFTIMT